MFNEIVVVKVDYFKLKGNVQSFDTTGKPDVILIPVCGKIPNQAQVLSGSVAMGAGITDSEGNITSSLQLVHVTERTPDSTYGRQFSVGKLSDMGVSDLLQYQTGLGKGNVEVTKVAEVADNGTTGAAASPVLKVNTSAAPGEAEKPTPEKVETIKERKARLLKEAEAL